MRIADCREELRIADCGEELRIAGKNCRLRIHREGNREGLPLHLVIVQESVVVVTEYYSSERQKKMKCPKCRQGELELGVTSLTYNRKGSLFEVQVDGVPAKICSVCGETYLSKEVGQELFDIVHPLLEAGQKMQPKKILPAPLVDIRFPPLASAQRKLAYAA